MCTGAEAAAVAAMAQNAAGEKQLGPTAPAFMPQVNAFGGGGFGGGFQPSNSAPVQQQKVGNLMQQTSAEIAPSPEVGPVDTTADEIGGNADILARAGQLGGDPSILGGLQDREKEQLGPFGKFFGNLDQNLQSPSKIIGMGLLGRIHPALGYGSLVAGGLLGPNKFRQ